MKLLKTTGALGLVTLAAIASPLAMADESGWYGGANIGRSGANIDDERITSGLRGQGLATGSIADRDRDTAYKLYGGYRLNRNIAFEGGWFDLGKFGYTATTVPAGTLNGDIRARGLNLDAVGILPITDRLSALGRVGMTYAQTRGAFSATGAARVPYADASPSKRSANYKFGAGLAYDFTDSLGMRVEAERYRINDAVGNKGDVDLFSVGLVFLFGGKTPAPAPRAVTPPPAPAPAAAPARRPEAVTPPPPARAVTPAPAPVETAPRKDRN